MFFKRKIKIMEFISRSYLKKKKKKIHQGAHSSPTVITTSRAGVKAEAAQTGRDTLVSLHASQYLAVQEKVVWFDVSVDEAKLVNRVNG